MRLHLPIVASALLCVFAGCSRSGDFGAFIVGEVARHGGHTPTNTTTPKLQARWTIKKKKDGIQAFVSEASFASIEATMKQAFGTNLMLNFNDRHGQPVRSWSAAELNVALYLLGTPQGAEVRCGRMIPVEGGKH